MKKKFSHSLPAQTLVEFSLVFPIIVVLLMVIFDLGRAVYCYSSIYNAAREGARYGIITQNETGIINAAKAKAIGLDKSQMNVSVSYPNIYQVEVQITYPFQVVTPIVCNMLNCNPLILHSISVMQLEK